jgi:hypothetical protein
MIGFAYRRVAAGDDVPGVIATTVDQRVGDAIEDILYIAESMPQQEIRDRVAVFLPLRLFGTG